MVPVFLMSETNAVGLQYLSLSLCSFQCKRTSIFVLICVKLGTVSEDSLLKEPWFLSVLGGGAVWKVGSSGALNGKLCYKGTGVFYNVCCWCCVCSSRSGTYPVVHSLWARAFQVQWHESGLWWSWHPSLSGVCRGGVSCELYSDDQGEWQQCHWFNFPRGLIIVQWWCTQLCGVWWCRQPTICFLAFMSEKSKQIFFRKDAKVYTWTWMSEWPCVMHLASHIWPVIRNTAKALNVSSQALIFDLGIVSDLFGRYLRKDGAVRCRQQLKLCCWACK